MNAWCNIAATKAGRGVPAGRAALVALLLGIAAALPSCARHDASDASRADVTLHWSLPDEPGSPRPVAFRVFYGSSQGALERSVLAPADARSYRFRSLPRDVRYFSVAAVDADGVESLRGPRVEREP